MTLRLGFEVMAPDPDEQRAATRDAWESAAAGWGRSADVIREWAMPVSTAMIDGLDLQAGQRVLELAAGPGDTGFMAAELIRPGGTLICSDGAEAMLDVARERAGQFGVAEVEFRQLELEWIDLETAAIDAVLCRWGLMFTVDPDAAVREIRRILRPDGRAALAVWDPPESNPWSTIPSAALIALGHLSPPDPTAPNMFAMAAPGRLEELLQDGGFTEVQTMSVPILRRYDDVDGFVYEARQMSPTFGPAMRGLDRAGQTAVTDWIADALSPFADDEGLVVPGSSLVAIASA
jgi:SAM-dependent methyltransferase